MNLAAQLQEYLEFLDCIRLEGITAVGHHGVYPEEKVTGQEFRVDAEIYVNTRSAGQSDDLVETVNYAQAAKMIEHILTGPHFDLLEALAAQLADSLLALPGVQVVQIVLHKPEAPLGLPAKDVNLRVWRGLENLNDRFLAEQHELSFPFVPVHDNRNSSDDEVDLDFLGPLSQNSPRLRQAREKFRTEQQEKAAYQRSLESVAVRRPKMDMPDQDGLDPLFDQRPGTPKQALIALGGNLGEVEQTLRSAIAQLRAIPGVGVVKVSSLYHTPALLRPDQEAQPDYCNAVALVRTVLSPRELWLQMSRIEQLYGRERSQRWGARTIDLDLIYYAGVEGSDVQLTLPHPEALNRAFVMIPWAELEPEDVAQDPQKIQSLVRLVADANTVKGIEANWLQPVLPGQKMSSLPDWNLPSHHLQTRRVLDEVLAAAGQEAADYQEITPIDEGEAAEVDPVLPVEPFTDVFVAGPADADIAAGIGTVLDLEPVANLETEPGSDPGSEPALEPELESEPELEPEANPALEPAIGLEPEPALEPEPEPEPLSASELENVSELGETPDLDVEPDLLPVTAVTESNLVLDDNISELHAFKEQDGKRVPVGVCSALSLSVRSADYVGTEPVTESASDVPAEPVEPTAPAEPVEPTAPAEPAETGLPDTLEELLAAELPPPEQDPSPVKTTGTWNKIKAFFGFRGAAPDLSPHSTAASTADLSQPPETVAPENKPEISWKRLSDYQDGADSGLFASEITVPDRENLPATAPDSVSPNPSFADDTDFSPVASESTPQGTIIPDLPIPLPPTTMSSTAGEYQPQHGGEMVTGDIPRLVGVTESPAPQTGEWDLSELAQRGEAAAARQEKTPELTVKTGRSDRRPILRPTTTGSIPVITGSFPVVAAADSEPSLAEQLQKSYSIPSGEGENVTASRLESEDEDETRIPGVNLPASGTPTAENNAAVYTSDKEN